MDLFSFFGAFSFVTAWEVVKDLGVPIGAAAAASIVVVRQIRQLDRHRTEDRRADGLLALAGLLEQQCSLIVNADRWRERLGKQYEGNAALVRAYAAFPVQDAPVVRWVALEREKMETEATAGELLGEFDAPTIGGHRAAALNIASDVMNRLLDWQRGSIDTEWFRARLREAGHRS